MDSKNILKYFFELGQMRRVKHGGWTLVGIENPDSIAEHSLRAAQIGYVLAVMEKYEKPDEVCAMLVFHDAHETRIGDLHKLARRYVTAEDEKAADEQVGSLGEAGERIMQLWKTIEHKEPPAGVIAKDADYLETAVTAKEYLEMGHPLVQDWIDNVGNALQTESAKRLWAELKDATAHDWWKGLKKLS
ncbi:MAG: HD domain-containing protein [Patescibacteria group bacterium]|nr:HD domain-containing protein [Patescibacteria group bacterium]